MRLPNAEELRRQMLHLDDEELLKIISDDRADYREMAIDIANKELRRRATSVKEGETGGLDRRRKLDIAFERANRPFGAAEIIRWIWILYVLAFAIPAIFQSVLRSGELDSFIHDLRYAIPVAVLGGLLILPLGISLYALREKHLAFYAHLEIFFGLFYGIYTIGDRTHWGTVTNSGTSDLATWTALASSLYIVVRGLDNRNKAKKVESPSVERTP